MGSQFNSREPTWPVGPSDDGVRAGGPPVSLKTEVPAACQLFLGG